ncbi:transmembrane and immunoglobulin domain-containing protein 1-like [Hypanus sabinus]|uniref:transmembrane and immunoglobulin domain-containing protein 1-like n=1 Tax=Hypanus sabinus TaxID=79690 RepID=UPI0028C3D212|nr:transmembrane and immunoglobulin domain-containing protein 1-like [Hypanus sabinus]
MSIAEHHEFIQFLLIDSSLILRYAGSPLQLSLHLVGQFTAELGCTCKTTCMRSQLTSPCTDICINDCTANDRLIKNISESLSLTCTVVNNRQDEELVWLREDRVINLKPLNRINVSTVCIDPITADDNNVTFSCHLSRNSTVKRSVLLDVRFVPILSQDGGVDVEAYSGDVVTLTCNVKSNPPALMSWHKDNNTLKMEAGKHHVNWDSSAFTLLIKKVQKWQNGTYVCRADSTLGSRSLYFNLSVKDKPYQVPYEPIIAGIVVILLTSLFGIFSRRHAVIECCRKNKNPKTCNETQ